MKDRYIKMMNKETIDTNFFYDYAVSKGFKYSVEEFNAGAVYVNTEIVLAQLNSEYDITILLGKNGEYIKIIT
jgi:hypothetical protein